MGGFGVERWIHRHTVYMNVYKSNLTTPESPQDVHTCLVTHVCVYVCVRVL